MVKTTSPEALPIAHLSDCLYLTPLRHLCLLRIAYAAAARGCHLPGRAHCIGSGDWLPKSVEGSVQKRTVDESCEDRVDGFDSMLMVP